MGKERRLIRVFFNTYYEDVAESVLNELKSLGYEMKMTNSRVVPELYYVEMEVGAENLDQAVAKVQRLLEEARDKYSGRLFGVKVYGVDASSS